MVIILCADILRRIYNFRALLSETSVLLQLIPPTVSHKTPHSTEQLLKILAAIDLDRSLKDRLLGRHGSLSLEVVSSRNDGIRFIVRVAHSNIDTFKRQIAVYMPELKFRDVVDYLEPTLRARKVTRLMEYRQALHFAYPLAEHNPLSEHDPINYITGSLTQLHKNELIAFQLVISPITPREAVNIRNKLILGKVPNIYQRNRALFVRIPLFLITVFFGFMQITLNILAEMLQPNDRRAINTYYRQLNRERPKVHSSEHQKLLGSLSDKLAQQLFRASIRAMIVTNDSAGSLQRARGISAAIDTFGVPGYQELVAKRGFPGRIWHLYWLWSLHRRLPALLLSQSCVLSAAELASLYHFPYGGLNTIENIARSHSRTLPAPAILKQLADSNMLDVVLGINNHHDNTTIIGLTEEQRERHIYVIGGTGNGKTTMMEYGVVKDMESGKGVAVIDPHGDMAEKLLRHVPAGREQDVVYFNPDDLEYPIGLNLLELPSGLTGDDLVREKDLVTESVVTIFRKIFSGDGTGGHRIEYVLRNAVQTALTTENPTLFTVFDLLNDPKYRRSVTSTLKDKQLKYFWDNELGKAGNMQQVKMIAGITAKIGRFLFSASAKRILEQPISTIDFDDILNGGKILICNFSKGLIGEDTSELFGITVLAKLQLASLRRARIDQTERLPFYLYVDEFQNFATQSFVQMLSESRKYRLFMVIAEQSTSQQADQQMVNIILANVGTVICFRTGNPNDERILLPLFSPYIAQGEISNLPAFNFYAKLSAFEPQEPMSGQTIVLSGAGSETVARRAIAHSRAAFAKKQTAQ